MKAIIMAAGKGTRISRHINEKPKCTVDIGNGKSLIEYSVEQLQKRGITDIVIILGYKGEIIEKILNGKNVKFYYNHFYDVTNSVASLWFAKEELTEEDTILMNGDVFFEEKFLDVVFEEKRSPVLYSDESRIEEADYRLYYKEDKLVKYGKELSVEETSGEYIGVARVAGGDINNIKDRIEELIREQKHSLWWENAIYMLSEKEDIFVKDISNLFWAEVDYIEDYIRIQEYIKKQ